MILLLHRDQPSLVYITISVISYLTDISKYILKSNFKQQSHPKLCLPVRHDIICESK